ncbi:hypothetical protein RGU70_08900 [Herbaspirillum sp. RTI4]|uniref:hypothetical protein n=1 Tax=Herbaspirillum sp. RTI4 TaxID=3048640 RepID=UPI002AB5459D|nr:hypothetical protein [Herbaspirillum sp. RTI4]MDY7578440.1 hypothetical protein [Herbaspirillum sp. RTI4]MEA9982546.1 hypothetical protein [Herbaspirillum sp. RTI4]
MFHFNAGLPVLSTSSSITTPYGLANFRSWSVYVPDGLEQELSRRTGAVEHAMLNALATYWGCNVSISGFEGMPATVSNPYLSGSLQPNSVEMRFVRLPAPQHWRSEQPYLMYLDIDEAALGHRTAVVQFPADPAARNQEIFYRNPAFYQAISAANIIVRKWDIRTLDQTTCIAELRQALTLILGFDSNEFPTLAEALAAHLPGTNQARQEQAVQPAPTDLRLRENKRRISQVEGPASSSAGPRDNRLQHSVAGNATPTPSSSMQNPGDEAYDESFLAESLANPSMGAVQRWLQDNQKMLERNPDTFDEDARRGH